MVLKEIAEKCGALGVDQERRITEEQVDLVFLNEDTDQWNKLFSDIFGNAAKTAGKEPTEEDQRLTEAYGGIRKEQTLFKKQSNGKTVIAMFWPWQDGIHTTLKMYLL